MNTSVNRNENFDEMRMVQKIKKARKGAGKEETKGHGSSISTRIHSEFCAAVDKFIGRQQKK